ncbi:MAG TPA: conjugal transfer protein TraV, partial [Pedomonas sp.]
MKPWFAVIGALVLGGCASWGGNVSGDFACKAPQGTCAPTAEIDARAVERAASSQRQAGPAPSPAGAWASRTALGAGLVRTGERVLRIVFYPRIDEAGVFHEPAVV